jgi:catechol 2,3-dioxygenase-like lactoylglutathione lyase family enzyme
MLKTTGITESCLYVDDVERAVRFYTALLSCPVVRRYDHLAALRVTEQQVLLLFRRGASLQASVVEGGTIPAHDGHGPLHVCFGMGADEVAAWETWLRELGIAIESRMTWPGGGKSLYFRDPDGHAVEIATPGLWD